MFFLIISYIFFNRCESVLKTASADFARTVEFNQTLPHITGEITVIKSK